MSPRHRLRALAADPGVRATVASRAIALVGAPVTLYLAATRLPARVQGYYFVAVNLVALAQLCELGLGTIIVQFASHEWPHLRWGRNGGLEGEPRAREAVAALLVLAVRWFSRAAVILLLVAGGGGAFLYGRGFSGGATTFLVLWVGFVLLAALYLPLVPFVCVAEGCGDLVPVQRMRAWQAGALLLGLWTGIAAGSALGAAWLGAAAQLLVAVVWLLRYHPGLLRAPGPLPAHLLRTETREAPETPAPGLATQYHRAQRRSAQLWLALHLAPQLLAPLLLALRGGDVAGRLGVTMALALAPLTIAVAWLHGRYPAFGALAAEGQTDALDRLAKRATAEAVAVLVAASVLLVGVVLLLPFVLPALAMRVLPLPALLALLGGSLASLLLQAMAGYGRAFREEALAPAIVAGSVVIVAAATAGALFGGVMLMTTAYAMASLGIAVPLAGMRMRRHRKQRVAEY